MNKKIMLTLLSLLSLPLITADTGSCWEDMGGMMYGNYGTGGILISGIISILFIVVLILLIV